MTNAETERLGKAAERIATAFESIAADLRLARDVAAAVVKADATRPLPKGETPDAISVLVYQIIRQRKIIE